MRKLIMQFAAVAIVCVVAGSAAFADVIIADDFAEGYALVSGTAAFVGDADWTGHVDYAVYAAGEYPGDHPDEDDCFIYAYQVFNDSTSAVTLSHFSVGLGEDASAANARYDITYGVSGGGIPMLSWLVGTPPTSVQWVGSWAPGTHSTVLLFSSPHTYTFDSGTLANGGTGDTQSVPSPSNVVPEPVTLLLLCGGVPVLLKYRRKASARV